MRRGRSTTIAAGLGLAALALLPVTASAAATLHPQPSPASLVRGDRAADGPVALRQATVVQDGPSLVWRLTTAESWTSSDLRGGHGRRICVSSHRADGSEAFRSCVGWRGRRLVVRGASVTADGTLGRWRSSAATVERRGQRTLVVRGPIATFGVEGRRLRWSAGSAWKRDADCPTAGGCHDRAPAGTRTASYTVRTPVVVGCTPPPAGAIRFGPAAAVTAREVALTFDDGPWTLTGGFLDLLRRYEVPATFFLIGQNIAPHHALLERMVAEGHAIGNHTWGHLNVAGGNLEQLRSTSDAIRAVTGVTPCVFRPPGGATGPALQAQAHALGMAGVLWSVDTDDWQLPGTATIVTRALHDATPGGIILMHDGGGPREATLAALPQIITGLRARGYRLVTVPQLLRLPQRYGYR